jgi:hypothetical protein
VLTLLTSAKHFNVSEDELKGMVVLCFGPFYSDCTNERLWDEMHRASGHDINLCGRSISLVLLGNWMFESALRYDQMHQLELGLASLSSSADELRRLLFRAFSYIARILHFWSKSESTEARDNVVFGAGNHWCHKF